MTEVVRQLRSVEPLPLEQPYDEPVAQAVVLPTKARTFARALTLLGILSLVFALFQWKISFVSETRAQRELRGAFAELLSAGTGLGFDLSGKPVGIAPGAPVALLTVPKIGLSKVVVEGTAADDLKRGPGHVSTSALPGQSGHAILAGRRATFGAPFSRIGSLVGGDDIKVVTPYGSFAYKVREVQEVTSGQVLELTEAKGSLLTLITADAGFSSTRAQAVIATLEGDPSTFADPPRPASDRAGAVPVGANSKALPAAAASGVLLACVLAVSGQLYARWRRWPTHLITTPPILALGFWWAQCMASLLPSTL